ncbi:unnamed protein product [Acanthosepion pharaonis]|uniref:Uncharacterized protein n=1 Tax=Acanthosepion pharaonis TaxID=158019 RepID=A0A812C585_ACAPH|nr:unnamed protein product [Sepia pharaonis]
MEHLCGMNSQLMIYISSHASHDTVKDGISLIFVKLLACRCIISLSSSASWLYGATPISCFLFFFFVFPFQCLSFSTSFHFLSVPTLTFPLFLSLYQYLLFSSILFLSINIYNFQTVCFSLLLSLFFVFFSLSIYCLSLHSVSVIISPTLNVSINICPKLLLPFLSPSLCQYLLLLPFLFLSINVCCFHSFNLSLSKSIAAVLSLSRYKYLAFPSFSYL